MTKLAIIGGTGLTSLVNLHVMRHEVAHTPYGEPSGPLVHGVLEGQEVIFLPRHGSGHTIPPHMINYRANLWALKEAGVKRLLAVAAVGGIHKDLHPAAIAIPDQLIDYTHSRKHTFFEEDLQHVTYIDFTLPYNEDLRQRLIAACHAANIEACRTGCYGAMQGPRLETAAEIDRVERDGCTMVGMTGMPEAALARELKLEYATCAVVANWAAGRASGVITMDDVAKNLKVGMAKVRTVLEHLLSRWS